MEKRCYLYLRTSADDRDKAGIPVQREGCEAYASRAGFSVVRSLEDDGISGTVPMDARPKGAELVKLVAENGVDAVIVWNGERIGRDQPVFWAFIGLCRAKHIAVLDHEGNDLSDSLQGGIHGMMAEMDRKKTVERLASGKRQWRGQRRVDGRWPFGEHPLHDYDWERTVVSRIEQMYADGITVYGIAKKLNSEGVTTRYGAKFKTQTIINILERRGKYATKRVEEGITESVPGASEGEGSEQTV